MSIYEICDRCGAFIKEGETRYIVRLVVAPDNGGVVTEPISDEEMQEIIEQFENANPAELENRVYEKREYILCPKCKKAFMDNPIGRKSGDVGTEEQD